ncbi:MAG: GNAT family N-acetyltransferase [Actinomycetota bacterium]
MIEIRELHTLQDQFHARMIFDSVWPASDETQITSNMLQAMVHGGSYLVGIFDDRKVIGASIAFPSIEPEIHLHSHMTAFIDEYRDRGLGTQVKMHQWSWAKERKYKSITWTYDPLVRRNARLNILKLGADLISYHPNFYGNMADKLNNGDESDRIMVRWDTTLDNPKPRIEMLEPPYDADLIPLPHDIVEIRRHDPELSLKYRYEVRAAFTEAFASDKKVIGFSANNEYVLE